MFDRGSYVKTPYGVARVLVAIRIPTRDQELKPIVKLVYRVMLTDAPDKKELDIEADMVTLAE